MKKGKTITAEEFDRLADTGCSMVPYLDMSTATRPGRGGKRLGAGRKVSGRQGRSIRLKAETWKAIDSEATRTKKTVSEVIEAAIQS
jgi:hypothetical protein